MDFGIIGFGRMGERYKNVLNSLGHEIKFISDISKIDTEFDFFENYIDAINNIPVDGLIISSHGPSHYEIMKHAISKNIRYIVCEKPFTTSVKHADEILELLKNSQTRLSVNYIRRYSNTYEKILDLLYTKNCIGIPKSMIISSGAGGISTIGTHFIDLATQILQSDVKSIFAYELNENLPNPRGTQFEDPGGYFILNFENKKRAFFEMGDDLGLQPKFEIIGEYGRMIIDEINDKLLIYSRNKEDRTKRKHLYGLPNLIIHNSTLNFESMEELIKKMLTNLISNDFIKSSADMAKKKVEIYSAIRKGFKNNNLVTLPLNNDDDYYSKQFMVT